MLLQAWAAERTLCSSSRSSNQLIVQPSSPWRWKVSRPSRSSFRAVAKSRRPSTQPLNTAQREGSAPGAGRMMTGILSPSWKQMNSPRMPGVPSPMSPFPVTKMAQSLEKTSSTLDELRDRFDAFRHQHRLQVRNKVALNAVLTAKDYSSGGAICASDWPVWFWEKPLTFRSGNAQPRR